MKRIVLNRNGLSDMENKLTVAREGQQAAGGVFSC